jgi:hypothetical protein
MKPLCKKILICILTLGVFSCTATKPTPIIQEVIIEVEESPVPGTVQSAWEEPMYDTVRMPAQIYGNTYRPSHNTIVEIRPRRYQPVQFPSTTNKD